MTVPVRGLGVFLASGDVARCSSSAAIVATGKLVRELGARWALIWCESYDGRTADPSRVARIGQEFRAQGIDPGVWSFPHHRRAAAAGARLAAIARRLRAPLAVGDLEDHDGPKGPARWSAADARAFRSALIDGIGENTTPAVTSYPGRTGHGMPWEAMEWGIAMPQCYATADAPALTERAIERARDAHGAVIPVTSLRSPGEPQSITPARLSARLDAVAVDGIDAVALWSLALVRDSREHREAVARWASRFERRIA